MKKFILTTFKQALENHQMMNSGLKNKDGAAKYFMSVIHSDQKDPASNLESRMKSVRMMSSLSPTPIKKEIAVSIIWHFTSLFLVEIINSLL